MEGGSGMNGAEECQRSPPRVKSGSHSNKVADLILSSCRQSDPSAHISSVLRDSAGRTVVRMRTNPNSNPLVVLRALQNLWPLAKCSVQENALDGTVEAEIIVPREKDEWNRALTRARKSRISELLWLLFVVLLSLALVSYANDCYTSFYNPTTGNFTDASTGGPATDSSTEEPEAKSEL